MNIVILHIEWLHLTPNFTSSYCTYNMLGHPFNCIHDGYILFSLGRMNHFHFSPFCHKPMFQHKALKFFLLPECITSPVSIVAINFKSIVFHGAAGWHLSVVITIRGSVYICFPVTSRRQVPPLNTQRLWELWQRIENGISRLGS